MSRLDNFFAKPKVIYRCIGRVRTTHYYTKTGFAVTKKFNVLKRKSQLRPDELIDNIEERLPINFMEVPDGLYELTLVNPQTDWETGYVEDFDVKLKPYKEGGAE